MKHFLIMLSVVLFCYVTAGNAYSADQLPRNSSSAAPAVLSIIPAQSEPGGKVVMSGSGFGTAATVFLGSVEIQAKTIDGKIVEFTVPSQLEAGMYALYLKRSDGAFGRPYNFTVLPLRPLLSALNPDHLSSCAQGQQREVTAQGQNFTEKSQLLFDGAAIRSVFVSPEQITFTVPQVAGGLHQIMVKNSAENGSVAMALAIETKPEIHQIVNGNESVNFYELLLQGNNFDVHSSIMVDGQQVGGRGQNPAEREKLIFVDCTKLIYQRHPYSPVNKDFRLQVINPGGEASQVITVTAP